MPVWGQWIGEVRSGAGRFAEDRGEQRSGVGGNLFIRAHVRVSAAWGCSGVVHEPPERVRRPNLFAAAAPGVPVVWAAA